MMQKTTKLTKDGALMSEPASSVLNEATATAASAVTSTLSQQINETTMNVPPTNRQESPAMIINLNQLEDTVQVKPLNIQEEDKVSSANRITHESPVEAGPPLSATVTKLNSPNGAEIYLIGTAHFSPQSVQDVQTVIRSVQPSSVILELCRERAFMLSLDEASLLEQNRSLSYDKIKSAIAEKGLAQGLIYIMFIKMSASLTEKLGMAPGAEFRAGSAEAMKIPGCSVILADRSLKTTVARAVASVSLWQKIKLICQVLINDVSITQDDVERCKNKDILEQLLQELGGEFPGFKRVLLDERNIYLAHSIYEWAQNSETSQGPQRIVAIVGIGHVAGIIEHWGQTTDAQVRELNKIPETSKTKIVITKTVKYCSLALLAYITYRTLVPSSIQATIYDRLFKSIGNKR